MKKKYSFEVNQTKKAFIVNLNDFFQPNEVQQLVEEFNIEAKKVISKRSFTIIVNCFNLGTIKQGLENQVSECMKMYENQGFKECMLVMPKSAITKMQFKKCGENDFLKRVKYFDTLEESLNSIK